MAIIVKKFLSWSISRLRDYERCAYYAAKVHLEKIKGPSSPAMERGSAIDKLATGYVRGELKRMPPEIAKFRKQFDDLRKDKTVLAGDDTRWAFDNGWKPVGYFDWDKAWLRVIADVLRLRNRGKVLVLIDNKTGRYNEHRVEEYRDQLKLYATAGMIIHPEVKTVETKIFFLDHGKTEEDEYQNTARGLTGLIDYWTRRAKPMLSDTRFAPRPGHYCSWCHLSKAKGGPCKY